MSRNRNKRQQQPQTDFFNGGGWKDPGFGGNLSNPYDDVIDRRKPVKTYRLWQVVFLCVVSSTFTGLSVVGTQWLQKLLG